MSFNPPRAILLDFDGTLADSIHVMKRVYNQFLEQFECIPTLDEFNSMNGLLLPEIIHCLKRRHNLVEEKEALLSIYNALLDDAYHNVNANIGALSLLKKANQEGCIIGIVTSNSKERIMRWLNERNFSSMIDFIVAKDDVKNGKPHPEPYLVAIEKTELLKEEIVAIEDSFQGAKSAIFAGLRILVIKDQKVKYVWPKEVELISSLTDVSNMLWPAKHQLVAS